MKKAISKIVAVTAAALIVLSSFTAFAASYTNSIGSVKEDIAILTDDSYTVVGVDETQAQSSAYAEYTPSTDAIESSCRVYATIAEGSVVYDPENPEADENGFVDGAIVVSAPTILIMSGTPDAEGYYIAEGKGKVKGNIAGTTIVNVQPASSVTLSQEGKDDITASITQNFTKFVVPTSDVTGSDVNKFVTPTFNDNCTFDITIKTNEATAGSWAGGYATSISLSTAA